jgi:hypothetical protein
MSCLKVICWALIFVFKLRFPPGVSTATFQNVYLFSIDTDEVFGWLDCAVTQLRTSAITFLTNLCTSQFVLLPSPPPGNPGDNAEEYIPGVGNC